MPLNVHIGRWRPIPTYRDQVELGRFLGGAEDTQFWIHVLSGAPPTPQGLPSGAAFRGLARRQMAMMSDLSPALDRLDVVHPTPVPI